MWRINDGAPKQFEGHEGKRYIMRCTCKKPALKEWFYILETCLIPFLTGLSWEDWYCSHVSMGNVRQSINIALCLMIMCLWILFRLCRLWATYLSPKTGLRSAFTQTCVFRRWGEPCLILCTVFKQNWKLWQKRVNVLCIYFICEDVSILWVSHNCGVVFSLLPELARMRQYKGEIINPFDFISSLMKINCYN